MDPELDRLLRELGSYVRCWRELADRRDATGYAAGTPGGGIEDFSAAMRCCANMVERVLLAHEKAVQHEAR